jgi:autotransporter-associated beta strand protein
VPYLRERRRLQWLLPLCAVLFLLAAAPKASAAGYSMTISDANTAGGSCTAPGVWAPSQDGANLNVNDIASCVSGGSLTIGDGGAIEVDDAPNLTNDSVTLDGDSTLLAGMTGLNNFTVEGTTAFVIAGTMGTSGTQSYAGPVTLDANTTFTASDVTFESTVDSGGSPVSLTVDGGASFEGAIGQISPLFSVAQSGSGGVDLGADVTTTDAQSYAGAATLTADAVLTSTGAGGITFSSTVDGAHQLTVSSDGAIDFGDRIGGTTPLAGLTTSGSGTVTLPSTRDPQITTSGAQDYGDTVDLGTGSAQTFTLSAGSFAFGDAIDPQSNGTVALVLEGPNAGDTGAVTFDDGAGVSVGVQNRPLAALTVMASGVITTDGGIVTQGSQLYTSAVQLAGDTRFGTGSGDITFDATIDGGHALTVSAAGTSHLDAAIGSGTAPESVTVTGNNDIDLGGDVTTTGDQVYARPVTLENNVEFDSAGNVGFQYALSGGGQITMSGGGTMDLANAGNSYTGGTVVTGGSTVKFVPGALGPSGDVTLNGGTLSWSDPYQGINTTDLSSRLQIGAGGGTLDTHGNDVAFANAIGGSGPLTKTGAGTLTLNAPSGSYGNKIIVDGGSVAVPAGTAVATPVQVDSGGTLNCSDGTLSGGVTNDGGTTTGAPGAPTDVTAAPGFEQATLNFNPGAANCYPVSYTVSSGTLSWTPSSSPATLGGLTGNQAYTFTLTAANPIGSASASSNTITAGPYDPSVSISAPANGATYTYGQVVDAGYGCQEGTGGLGIKSCAGPISSGAALDTTAPGQHTFTVTATSLDGLTASSTVTYTVLPPPPSTTVATPSYSFKVKSIRASRNGRITVSLSSLSAPGTITATERGAKLPAIRVHRSVGTKPTLTFTIGPSKRLRALLRHRHVSVKLTIAYTPTHGTTGSVVRSVRLR